jgi:PiT family inorganic phosphate transporter
MPTTGISPGLLVVLVLVLTSEFVNGWTDAPNSIATVVSTRVMSPRAAVVMAVVFNFLGVLLMGTAVANTIGGIIKLAPGNEALAVIGAAQFGIVVWGIVAWRFGLPTSESHALVAGLTGAGLATSSAGSAFGIDAVNWASWIKVLQGLLVSSVLGFGLGYFVAGAVTFVFRNVKRPAANWFFSKAQIVSAAAMSFSHGTQDGQKFMGVFARAMVFAGILGLGPGGALLIPVWVMALCSLVMAVGTSIGGYRIIKTMGMDMVKLEKYQGFSAEVAASLCLLVSSAFGIPVSTTHTKTTAIIGVGAWRGARRVKWNIVGEMFLAWFLTFPVCALIGFVVTKLFLLVLR